MFSPSFGTPASSAGRCCGRSPLSLPRGSAYARFEWRRALPPQITLGCIYYYCTKLVALLASSAQCTRVEFSRCATLKEMWESKCRRSWSSKEKYLVLWGVSIVLFTLVATIAFSYVYVIDERVILIESIITKLCAGTAMHTFHIVFNMFV